jgi:microcystin-dependent protein
MPLLSVVKNYADNTILTQQQLNQAFESVEAFVNNTKLDAQNIQASAITSTELAADSVTTDKVADANIDLSKLATEVINRLMPAGTIIASGATVAPQGYIYCNGAAVSRTVFAALFNSIGTAYGNGDGSTTFNVPDTRGYFLRGQSNGTGQDPDAGGRYSNTGGNVGDLVGSVQDQSFLSHNHTQNAHNHGYSDPGHAHSYETRQGITQVSGGAGAAGIWFSFNGFPFVATNTVTTGIAIQAATATNNATGQNETRPKNVYVRHYIKT